MIFSRGIWILAIICFFLLAILLILPPISYFGLTPNEIGDYYGGTVGVIASLLATFFILISLLDQRQQIIKQNNNIARQEAMQAFYQILTIRESIIRDMDVDSGGDRKYVGRDCFKIFRDKIDITTDSERLLNEVYSTDLFPYLQFLGYIGSFINENIKDQNDRKFCFGILQSTFSSDEKYIIEHYRSSVKGLETFN